MPRVAILQGRSTPFDTAATLHETVEGIGRAAAAGATLAVFGETWLGGYPAWIDHWPELGLWDRPAAAALHARYRQASISVPGPETKAIARAAATHGISVALGASERVDAGPGRGTLYNALLVFGHDGTLLIHHRKLIPTHTERLVWGPGDGCGLRAVDTPAGRLGGLVCWEHWMPLARHALHCDGEDIHVALWPTVGEPHLLASRHYAFEGRCFVLAAGSLLSRSALPPELADALVDLKDDALMRGGSVVIGPDGRELAAPVYDEPALVLADLDFEACERARMTLDVAGHYHRPDVFQFEVDRRNRRTFPDGEPED